MENEEKAAQAGSASVAAKPAAKRPRRGAIVGGVIAAVVVVAGIGAFVWHEQPSFCNAICHTPMDGYLETYEAEPGQAATDKWGNQVADASGILSAVHRTNDSNATCLSCHQPVISEQVSEGMEWISGNYTLVATDGNPAGELTERGTSQLTEARGVAGDEFCMNKDCHNLTREDLTKLTEVESSDPSVIIRNPHSWQHGQQACSDCHKAHRASVLTCTQCHADVYSLEAVGKENLDNFWIGPALESGVLKKADTLEELAGIMGFEGETKKTFLATVERYNQLYDQGEDVDFGKPAYRMSSVTQPPFYAARIAGTMLVTMHGVITDTNSQPLREDGSVIDGLYVCGNDQGGFYPHHYPSNFTGINAGRTATFARIAAKHACGVK